MIHVLHVNLKCSYVKGENVMHFHHLVLSNFQKIKFSVQTAKKKDGAIYGDGAITEYYCSEVEISRPRMF